MRYLEPRVLGATAFALFTLAGAVASPLAVTSLQASQPELEMLYDELAPKQRALVDDWIARYDALRSEALEPTVYNEFPLSVKTTFVAVTHALSKTPLTDAEAQPILGDDGEPMTGLDLVARLDAVKGRVKGAPGDEQFRIYVQLVPGAVDLLEESKEFYRSHDNTVYHKGYPMSYRSSGGVPSIQFSIALNGQSADIDVDYRSSKFPAALVNGHLTAANSDVRAGDNYNRHVASWVGLQNWWAGWEGLGDWFAALYGMRGLDIPKEGKKSGGSADEAVQDFLQSWLVEEQPAVAMSYFSKDIYRCMDDDEREGDSTPEQRMFRKMSETVRVVGNPRNLSSVVQGVNLANLSLPPVADNPHHDLFVLYSVPNDRVIEFDCRFQSMSVPRARRAGLTRSGDYVLATLFLKSGEMRGVTAALLWTRESDGWKMISFELEPAVGLVPDLHAPPPVPRARGGEDLVVPPELARASEAFLDDWLVARDYDGAMSFVSPESYRCLDVFGEAEPSAAPDPAARLGDALRTVSEFVGDIDRETLSEAIARVEPWSPGFRDVTPSGHVATLVALPDGAAAPYRCLEAPTAAETEPAAPVEPTYGTYFGTAFRLKLASGEQPGAFFVLWGQDRGTWKVVAFNVLAE